MMLYIAFINENIIDRIEIDWAEPLVAIEIARDLIKKNFDLNWNGTVIIDNKPVLSDESKPMFFAKAVRGPKGAVDFQASVLNWRYPDVEAK